MLSAARDPLGTQIGVIIFFSRQFFTFPPQKSLFPQTPTLFSHLSNYCFDKPLTYPSTLGGAYPNRRGAFHDEPYTLKCHVGKKRGDLEIMILLQGKSEKAGGKIYIPWCIFGENWNLEIREKKMQHGR